MAEALAPPHGELRVVDDVPTAFAALVATEVAAAPSAPFRLVLSGGSTARACYERLASEADMAWGGVEVLVGDERCVPPDDDDANQRLIRQALGAKLDASLGLVPMDCGDPDAYDATVAARQPLDLVHLGLGPDGHTASLFPGSAGLAAPPDRLVVLNEDPNENNPHRRMTLTFTAINRARLAVFTVAGAEKHAALHSLLTTGAVPAARVQSARVVWLCDRAALGKDALAAESGRSRGATP